MIDTEPTNCQKLVELVTDYLEAALGAGDLRRFEEHLAVCTDCERYLEQLRETVRITGTLTIDDVSPAAERTLVAAFRDWASVS